jgi:pyruvate/2-oxoglutarate dehydrogenase complex dihydrolipoamide acyltransferase (E2) component
LVQYLAKEGSIVEIGTPIALVENKWALFHLNANGRGTLKKTFFDRRTSISVGDPVAVIGADGENIPYGQSYALLSCENETRKIFTKIWRSTVDSGRENRTCGSLDDRSRESMCFL